MSIHPQNYRSIAAPAEGLYKEKGSKFLAFAYPVESEETVKERLEDLRRKYYDARHHCYAYVLGPDRAKYRANDDGEPGHSAGDPILGQIHSKDLTNVLIVVVRYFGGTKLGVSGLINAYRVAAEDALNHAKIVEVEITRGVRLRYAYQDTNEVMRMVSDLDITIKDQDFGAGCVLEGEVKVNFLPLLEEKVQLLKDTGHPVGLEVL